VRRTILDGLPSATNLNGGEAAPSGPSGLIRRGDTLYMAIGAGDATTPGPVPGSEMENPTPASPILSSVLSIRASAGIETGTESFTLTLANHTLLKSGGQVVLTDTHGNTLTIALVFDFPNFVAQPRPDFAANVRGSNPFGVAVSGNLLYVNDAGLNLVSVVGITSHTSATLTTFAPIPRSTTVPPGPPVMDAVPDSVRLYGDQLLVTQIFTGQVVRVDAARFFVRLHYLDFLGREPDIDGWNFWTNQITQCGNDDACRDRKQVDVSRAFYYSAEFIAAHPELAANLRGTTTYNREFVRQAYFTYLKRTCDPETCDSVGFNFWVGVLNSKMPNKDEHYNEMIHAFIVSGEYRSRLGLS
jgi:hypothetical protein